MRLIPTPAIQLCQKQTLLFKIPLKTIIIVSQMDTFVFTDVLVQQPPAEITVCTARLFSEDDFVQLKVYFICFQVLF